MHRPIILRGKPQRDFAKRAIDKAPTDYVVTIRQPTRSLEQNAKLWPMLKDISEQVEWYGEKLTKDEWKDVFTAALNQGQKAVMGIDGGIVMIGLKTSQLPVADFADLIEIIYAFGARQGVVWSEPESEAA